MEYLTCKEYAELKGCSEQYVQKCAKDGKITAECTVTEKNRPKYLIPISALPDDIKTKYYKKLTEKTGLAPELRESEIKTDVKTPKTAPRRKNLDEFTEKEREEIALWSGIIREWLTAREKFKRKTEADPLFCGKIKLEHPDIDISPDILYRKYSLWRENDLEGLVDKRGGWNRGQCCIDETVFGIFTSYWLTPNRLSVENCYNKTVAVCKEYYPELVGDIPSSRTFRRAADKIPAAVVEYARKGKKAFLDKYLEYAERDLSNCKCNDIWIADNHTLDFFTLSDDGRVHRPSITVYQDAKSGIITAAELCDHPNSDTTLLALRSAILQGYGIPQGVYFDNGSEFLASDIGGRGHRRKAQWQKNEKPLRILELLGIQMVNAIPRNARAKPIERFFNTFKEHYSKSMESYSGGKPDERPENNAELLKSKMLITDAELREILPIFIKGHNSELYGGKENQYKKMRRIDVWNKAVRENSFTFRTSDKDNLTLLMLRTGKKQKISRNGVFIEIAGKKVWFKDDETVFHTEEEVYVRFDPANLEKVRVYDAATDKLKYIYPCADYLDIPFIGAKEEQIQNLMRSQANTRKRVKSRYEEYKKYDAVSLLQAEILRAQQNSKDYEIATPIEYISVISNDNDIGEINITKISAEDIKKMNDVRNSVKGA